MCGVVLAVLAGLVSMTVQSPPKAKVDWQLSDTGYTYIIHGVTNYDRGATYYLYREKNGIRDVVLVDPQSPVDLALITDKPVVVNGQLVKRGDGVDMVRITSIKLK